MARDMLRADAARWATSASTCWRTTAARASRTGWRSTMPTAVRRLVLLDIAPTLAMYEQTTEAFARAYWHWFFLIQPAPLPERLIEADPAPTCAT